MGDRARRVGDGSAAATTVRALSKLADNSVTRLSLSALGRILSM